MNSPNQDLLLYVIIGIAAMFVFGFSFLLMVVFSQRKKSQLQKSIAALKEQQQNQLIEAAIRSEETERHRIADTLHDEVGAILSSAKLHLLGIKTDALDERDKKLHDKGGFLMNEVIQKVRGISHNLHSNILKEFGLNEAIRHFLDKIIASENISTETELDENYVSERPENDMSIYRLLQELINNILKYASASKLSIKSIVTPKGLLITVFHNGHGLTQEQFEKLRFQKDGLGLKNIQNRIILLKGDIEFTRTSDGYEITILIPANMPST